MSRAPTKALWTGLSSAATGAMLFISSPFWGSLADRFGRKNMLLRAYAGAMVTITLQALVQTVWQLVALRALQGLFVGTIPLLRPDRVGHAAQTHRLCSRAHPDGGIPVADGRSRGRWPYGGSRRLPHDVTLGGIMYVISFALCWFFVKEDFGVPHRASGSRISETFAR